MKPARPVRTASRRPPLLVVVFVAGLLAAFADSAAAPRPRPDDPPPPEWTRAPDAPDVRDTATNLQAAFTNEMNAYMRYMAWRQQAETEGLSAIARLFRACAVAESIHARRCVQAIALTGQPARAVLERLQVGSTAQNLETAIGCERYECEVWYPALRSRALADRMPMAVRSLTLAAAAERGHLALLERARASLTGGPLASAYFVCPYCGRTCEARPAGCCPACFTRAGRFVRPA